LNSPLGTTAETVRLGLIRGGPSAAIPDAKQVLVIDANVRCTRVAVYDGDGSVDEPVEYFKDEFAFCVGE